MRLEEVEIYSDATNAAVMRHPDRRFPGLLIQGDTLYSICCELDAACTAASGRIDEDAFLELNELRNRHWKLLKHYQSVLTEHGLPSPFSQR